MSRAVIGQRPKTTNGELIREVKVEVVRTLTMLDGRTMIVYMTNDGKIHQEVFDSRTEAENRAGKIREMLV